MNQDNLVGMTKENSLWPSSSSDTTLVSTPGSPTLQESKMTVEDVASKAIDKMESIVQYTFHELPSYQQDNHYILSGYRGELKSFKRCFGSLWYLHNESGRNLTVYVDTSEYMVTFTWRNRIRSSCRICFIHLSTTLSYILIF